ncbi:MAG: FAD:protein FMN transferase [Kiloniellales bacterium]|nr:FAD:protein FMN transferase [Kiloniellales bacterium]
MTETLTHRLPRRRFIAIAGAAAGYALFPAAGQAGTTVHRWRGTALGAVASIDLVHPDAAAANRLLDGAVAEISRLERIFSLYRGDSALSRLNRDGVLTAPPLALVELLSRACDVSRLTGGAFDATIQPLWRRYADHFAGNAAADAAPPIDDVLPLVDWRSLEIAPARVAFKRPGMAVTLNGIAQGFITDRVAALLRRNGVDDVLLDLGEIRGMGRHPDGRPWRAAIVDPADPERRLGRIELAERALATSGGYGTLFDAAGHFSHLIDPRTGRTAPATRSLTVAAPDATTADGLSTAFAVMDESAIAATAATAATAGGGPDWAVYVADRTGLRRIAL